MKTAKEYLADSCAQPFHSPAGPTVPLASAEAAVQAALDDAERYRHLLAQAIRNSTSPTSPTSPQPTA